MNTGFSIRRTFRLYRNLLLLHYPTLLSLSVLAVILMTYELLSANSFSFRIFFKPLIMMVIMSLFFSFLWINKVVHQDPIRYFTNPCLPGERYLSLLFFSVSVILLTFLCCLVGGIIWNLIDWTGIQSYMQGDSFEEGYYLLPFGRLYIPNLFRLGIRLFNSFEGPVILIIGISFFLLCYAATFCLAISARYALATIFVTPIILVLSVLILSEQAFFVDDYFRNEIDLEYRIRYVWISQPLFQRLFFIVYSGAFVLLMYAAYLKLKEKQNR